MRQNENLAIVGQRVVLVPYREHHVKKYHDWMEDEVLREQTASQRLTLDEEYAMQRSWREDPDKLTFIILKRNESTEPTKASIDQLDSDPQNMVGDVNLFFSEKPPPTQLQSQEKENGHDQDEEQIPDVICGECEIMIASKDDRKSGFGLEALALMLQYAASMDHDLPPIKYFFAHIGLSNTPSKNLLQKLNFQVTNVIQVFDEVQLAVSNSPQLLQHLHSISPLPDPVVL